MTKAEIIKELALRSGIHPSLAEHLYDNLSDILAEGCCRDHRVPVGNLGYLQVSIRAPHEGRNPQTKESIWIPARPRMLFRMAKPFLAMLERALLSVDPQEYKH